jgi:catechol 2,3-dioxygenase
MSAGGYHHHLGTNTWAASAPVAADDDAKLIEWEVVVPTTRDVADAAASLESSGFRVERHGETAAARDPWGTQLRLVSETR